MCFVGLNYKYYYQWAMFEKNMGGDSPLMTMVKSKEIGKPPLNLTKESGDLLETLSGLCSFYTVSDFASFLFSDQFRLLIEKDEPWVVFEIGLYSNHEKNMQLIPSKNKLLFIDNVNTDWNNGIYESNDRKEIINKLNSWCEMVFNQ